MNKYIYIFYFQNVTKTRTTEHCCVGYAEVQFQNDTTCVPTCRGGCVQGYCSSPNLCKCNIGYEGRHCAQSRHFKQCYLNHFLKFLTVSGCRHKMYGQNCMKMCKCRNNALCDHKTGFCRCNAGWIGELYIQIL